MTIQFTGGSPAQQAAIQQAHETLDRLLGVLAHLALTPRLETRFGSGVTSSEVRGKFDLAHSALQSSTFNYDLTTPLEHLFVEDVYLQFVNVASGVVSVQVWPGFWDRLELAPGPSQDALVLSIFHELGVSFAGLLDFTAPQAPDGRWPDQAKVAVRNYMDLLETRLDTTSPVSPPGGLFVASASNAVTPYQTLDGSTIGTVPIFMQEGALTAAPAALGRIAVFGEGNASGLSNLHAYDTYLGLDLLASGSQLPGSVDSTPAVIGTTVWVCTGNGTLVQVDMSNPSSPVATPVLAFASGSGSDRMTACLLSDDQQTLYTAGSLGAFAIALAGPTVDTTLSGNFSAVPAVLASGVLVAADGTTLYGMTSSGSWTITLPATIEVLLSTEGEQVLANGASDSFVVVDVCSQATTTITPGTSNIAFAQTALVGNLVLVADNASQLACYQFSFLDQQSTWTRIWSATLAGNVAARPAFADGLVYVIDTTGLLTVLDVVTGDTLFTTSGLNVPTTAPLSVTPYVNVGDGAIYSQSDYQGSPSLLSALPGTFPAVAGCVVPAPWSYALFTASGAAIGEVAAPTSAVSLPSTPDGASGVALSTVQSALGGQGVPTAANWLGTTTTWLGEVAANQYGLWFVVSSAHSVFGPNVAMLDFDGSSLSLARQVGGVVQLGGSGSTVPSSVQQALAMSGSTAQDEVQANPGDLDFTQRIHIAASTQAQARSTLADIVQTRVTTTPAIPGLTAAFIELKFGVYPFDFQRTGSSTVSPAGSPIAWSESDVVAGQITGTDVQSNTPATITWADAAANPVWIKFDWIFSIPSSCDVMNTSNVLDPTWVDSTGAIHTLDSAQDAFIQEIYLDTSDSTLVATLYAAIGQDLRQSYLEQLELEVKKFGTPTSKKYNLGKVAKRLYNLTRMNGRFVDGAYLRTLFGAPITVIYMVWSRVKGIGEAALETSIPPSDISAQTAALITAVQNTSGLDTTRSATIISDLTAIQTALGTSPLPSNFSTLISTCQADALSWVNEEFDACFQAMPGLEAYVQQLVSAPATASYVARRFPRIYEGPEDWDPEEGA